LFYSPYGFTNVRFDTNQPPYRILFQREVNTTCLLIATAETESVIENAWSWIVEKMIPQLDNIDEPYDKEEWVASKIQHIVTHIGMILDGNLTCRNTTHFTLSRRRWR
jgi:hypothetical protein